jgi:hypothetical protein
VKTTSTARACAAAATAAALLASAATLSLVGTAAASTEVVVAPLAAPQALAPDDSTAALPHAVLKTVSLSWGAVSGATGYRVQVGTDGSWSDDKSVSFTSDVASTSVTLPVSLPHATYVWRVAALKGSAVGHWSSEEGQAHSDAQFTRGWRDAPQVNTVTFSGLRPSFSWSPVKYASGYQIQISSTPFPAPGVSTSAPDTTSSPTQDTQASIVDTTCFTPRTRLTPFTGVAGDGAKDSVGRCDFNIPDPGTTLYWRVRALDKWKGAAATGPTVPVSQAGISYLPPTTDAGGATAITSDCNSPSASPSASATASASPTSTASPSASPVAGSGETGTSNCADPSDDSERGDWTSQATFVWSPSAAVAALGLVKTDSVSQDPDGLCTVTNPGAADAEKGLCSDFPTISWNGASTQAARYRVYVALDDAFTNIQSIAETSGHQWTPTTSWRESSPSLSYYYAVQACDATACGPVTSTPPSFRKVTPRPLTMGTPAVKGTLALNWQSYAADLATATGKAAPEDAWYYHVEIATADHPSYDAMVDNAAVDQESYTPTTDLGDGSFVWRVQAVDSFGNMLPWSKSQAFVRDTTAPRAVRATPSAGVTAKKAVVISFSEPVTGLSSSTLLAVTSGGNAPVSVSVAGDRRSATLVPTRPWVAGAAYAVRLLPAVKDAVGNSAVATGPGFTVTKTVDDASGGLVFGTGWSSLSSSNAHGGTFHRSGTAGRSLSMTFNGSSVTLVGCLGPGNGYATVSVGGVAKRFGLYRSYSGCGVTLGTLSGLGRGTHTVKVSVAGTHPAGSRGNNVDVDYLAVS